MTGVASKTVLLAVTATLLLAASPAFAWTCTARNARGAHYTAVGILKANTQAKVLAMCRADSGAQRSCVILACTLP